MSLDRLTRAPFELQHDAEGLRVSWFPRWPRVAEPLKVAVGSALVWGAALAGALWWDAPGLVLMPFLLGPLYVMWAMGQMRFMRPDRLWVRGGELWVETLTETVHVPLPEARFSMRVQPGRGDFPSRSTLRVDAEGVSYELFRGALTPAEGRALLALLDELVTAQPAREQVARAQAPAELEALRAGVARRQPE